MVVYNNNYIELPFSRGSVSQKVSDFLYQLRKELPERQSREKQEEEQVSA